MRESQKGHLTMYEHASTADARCLSVTNFGNSLQCSWTSSLVPSADGPQTARLSHSHSASIVSGGALNSTHSHSNFTQSMKTFLFGRWKSPLTAL